MKKFIIILIVFIALCSQLIACTTALPDYEYTYYPDNTSISGTQSKALFIQAIKELSVKTTATIETLGEAGRFEDSTYLILSQGLQLQSQEKPLAIKIFRKGMGEDCQIIVSETFFDSEYNYAVDTNNYTVRDYIENRREYTRLENSIIQIDTSVKFGTVNTDYYQPVLLSNEEQTIENSIYPSIIAQYSDSLVFPAKYTYGSISFEEQSESFYSGVMSGLQGVIRFNNFSPSNTNLSTMFDISIILSRGQISEINYKSYEYLNELMRRDCSCLLGVSYSPEWINPYSGNPIEQ